MAPDAEEASDVSLVGYHDLEGRPAFKMAIQKAGGRWYLYLAHFWHSGWTILDVTDPADPQHVTFLEGPDNTMTLQMQVAEGTMITSMEKPRSGHGLVGDTMDPADPYEEGFYVWDVESDPEDPALLGQHRTGGNGTHRNFYNGGDYVYTNTKLPTFDGSITTVVDISDPTDPEEVAQWWWPGQAPGEHNRLREHADYPKKIHYFHGPTYVEGDVAYLSYGQVGMVILDVSDPTDPTFKSRLSIGDIGSRINTHSAVPIPDTDLVAVNTEARSEGYPLEDGGEYNPVFIVDVRDKQAPGFAASDKKSRGPKVVSALPIPAPEDHLPYDNYYRKGGRFGPHNQHHYREGNDLRLKRNDLLFMTFFNAGLRVFDISDPLVPREAGYYVPEDPAERIGTRPERELVTHFEDVLVDARGNIYCTDTNHGLHILETSLL